METKQGEISLLEVKDGVGSTGNAYRRGVFTINDLKYSTFDQKIIDAFKPGDYVSMTGEQQGNFWNMKTMVVIPRPEGNGPVEAPIEKFTQPRIPAASAEINYSAKTNGSKEYHLSPEQVEHNDRLVKKWALESAIEWVSPTKEAWIDNELLGLADKFVKWIYK